MGKRVRVGDVIEIPTSRGFAYAQYSLKNAKWGALLRILPGFHGSRPKSFSEIVAPRERFVVFFPLQAAVNRNIFKVVANEEVPPHARVFPTFRAAGHIDRQGHVHDWWIWDGQKQWRVEKLTAEQRKLPIRALWNDTLLVKRIEEDWSPEKDPR